MPLALLSAALLSEVELGADNAPPTAFRIFRAGINRSTDGDFLFDEEAARQVMAAAQEQGHDFAFDYGHGMFSALAVDIAEAGKAAGWFSLELRGGELWAKVKTWSQKAAAYLAQKEYRFFSPAFRFHAETKRITRLLNVALTNVPKLLQLEPLMAAAQSPSAAPPRENRMDLKTLIALLGLKADATEAEVTTCLASQGAALGQSRELLQLCGANTLSEALGKVRAWQEGAKKAEELAAQVAKAQADARALEVEQLLSQAVTSGKVAPSEKTFLASAMGSDIAQLKAYLDARTKAPGTLVPTAPATQPAAGSGVAVLSQSDIEVARMMGVDPTKLAEHKQKLGLVVPAAS